MEWNLRIGLHISEGNSRSIGLRSDHGNLSGGGRTLAAGSAGRVISERAKDTKTYHAFAVAV